MAQVFIVDMDNISALKIVKMISRIGRVKVLEDDV